MKKPYLEVSFEVHIFANNDVLTTSGGNNWYGEPNDDIMFDDIF